MSRSRPGALPGSYFDKNGSADNPIHLIGVEFSRQHRQIVSFEVETIT